MYQYYFQIITSIYCNLSLNQMSIWLENYQCKEMRKKAKKCVNDAISQEQDKFSDALEGGVSGLSAN